MNINVYLPDDLGTWGKAEEVNFSALLREAVLAEKDRREALSTAIAGAEELMVDARNGAGRQYRARFVGKAVVVDSLRYGVYLTVDHELVVIDSERDENNLVKVDADDLTLEDVQSLVQGQEAYVEICHAIGLKPIVDL